MQSGEPRVHKIVCQGKPNAVLFMEIDSFLVGVGICCPRVFIIPMC